MATRLLSLESGRPRRRAASTVGPADAFFHYAETAAAPQHVGGVVPLDVTRRAGGPPTRAEVEAVVRERLGALPRFHQRLLLGSRWHRPRWVEHEHLDWQWHVPLVDLHEASGRPGGQAALEHLVGQLMETPLPPDRPLWRLVVVHGVAPGRAVVILLVHHVVADGIGTVLQSLRLLDPPIRLPVPLLPRPGPLRRAAGTAVGLAQLAGDGRLRRPWPGDVTGRAFTTAVLPLERVRAVARRHGARVSDLVLCLVAGAVSRCHRGNGSPGGPLPALLRVSVPLLVRPGDAPAEGNLTAAVMVDVPLREMPEPRRLRQIVARTHTLGSGTRALASRFVMADVGRAIPAPLLARFARTVYGPRHLHAVVSNMPGPPVPLALAGAPVLAAFPLLPPAPGTPLAVGALSWNGDLCLGIIGTPQTLGSDRGGRLDRYLLAVLEELDEQAATLDLSSPPVDRHDTPSATHRDREITHRCDEVN